MSAPAYNEKLNRPLSTEYYHAASSPNPTIQQAQSFPMGNPTMAAAGDYPMGCNCPHCHQSIVTRTEKDNGLMVWLSAGGICLLGFICGCCLIPFCIDGLKDTVHYCPNCNLVIARNKKL